MVQGLGGPFIVQGRAAKLKGRRKCHVYWPDDIQSQNRDTDESFSRVRLTSERHARLGIVRDEFQARRVRQLCKA